VLPRSWAVMNASQKPLVCLARIWLASAPEDRLQKTLKTQRPRQTPREAADHVTSRRRTEASPACAGETDLEMRSRTTLMVRSIGTKPVLSASATTIVAKKTNALLGLNPRPVTSTAAIGM
jgi:hypothetical protein